MIEPIEYVGWGSSIVLLATICSQVWTQWQSTDNDGVSVWLYVGQCVASAGFLVYSLSLRNWVFVATNTLLLGAAITGLTIYARNARRDAGDPASDGAGSAGGHAAGVTR